LEVNYALLLGFIVGLSVLIPYLGAAVATLPIFLIGFFQSGADEALMLNTRGNVASGAASNIFLVIDGRVRTPALEDGALPGTVRAALLDAALGVEVGAIAAEDAARAEAAFITNALNPFRAVKSIDGRVLDAEHAQISILRQPARDAP
jgi:branched-subunit amino acid aminotransferase/4-amino-4-deoxychorismate lyase